MTLIKFALLVLITVSGQPLSFSAALNLDDVVTRWNNEEEMKPYFKAISAFKEVLDKEIKKQDPKARGEPVTSPFTGKMVPFPYFSHNRSSTHLFLKMSGSEEEPLFSELWTPFGKIDVFNGGAEAKKKDITQAVFDVMKKRWKLEDVTEKVQLGFLIFKADGAKSLENIRSFDKYKKDHKLFLIKPSDAHVFVEEKPQEVTIFEAIIDISFREHRRSGDLFSKLSKAEQSA